MTDILPKIVCNSNFHDDFTIRDPGAFYNERSECQVVSVDLKGVAATQSTMISGGGAKHNWTIEQL